MGGRKDLKVRAMMREGRAASIRAWGRQYGRRFGMKKQTAGIRRGEGKKMESGGKKRERSQDLLGGSRVGLRA